MATELNELSSMASSLEQLAQRFSSLADQAVVDKDEKLAAELIGVERSLSSARRRLSRLLSSHPR